MANEKSETSEKETASEGKGVAVAGKVSLVTWQKVKYLSLRRSMATGQNITMSRCVGDILDKAAEGLDAPPADLVSE